MIDVVGVRDVDLGGSDDPGVLGWATVQGRVLLTHDVSTMLAYADARIHRGLHHPGVIKVPQLLAVGRAIGDLEYVARAASHDDLGDQILHLPL